MANPLGCVVIPATADVGRVSLFGENQALNDVKWVAKPDKQRFNHAHDLFITFIMNAIMTYVMYNVKHQSGVQMKISRERVVENRRRILDSAARLFRERGFEGVTVAEIMNDAGLTHGAFYGHFASKDELMAQAFHHVLTPHADKPPLSTDLHTFARNYLSVKHRDNVGDGCLFSSLGSEAARASSEARHILTESVRSQIANFSKSAPGQTPDEKRQAAVGSWAAMIGAITLSRLVDDDALSDQLLADTQAWLTTHCDERDESVEKSN
jgi:TetR/AcrR family transcriptional repressor of nem operon